MRKSLDETMGSLAEEDGKWERPYPRHALAVPRRVWSVPDEDGILRWSAENGWAWREPSFEMLVDFTELAEAPADRIVAYAQRWGVLMLCKHHLPLVHNPFSPSNTGRWCEPLWNSSCGRRKESGWEFVAIWRKFAREARAIMRAAQVAASGSGSITAADIHLLVYGSEEEPSDEAPRGVDWSYIRPAVNRWLDLGDVRPRLAHLGGRPMNRLMIVYGMGEHFEWDPGCGLFASLAVQLMLSTSSDSIPYRCRCGRFFKPDRPNQTWCRHPMCGRKGRNRAASKKSYAKLHASRR